MFSAPKCNKPPRSFLRSAFRSHPSPAQSKPQITQKAGNYRPQADARNANQQNKHRKDDDALPHRLKISLRSEALLTAKPSFAPIVPRMTFFQHIYGRDCPLRLRPLEKRKQTAKPHSVTLSIKRQKTLALEEGNARFPSLRNAPVAQLDRASDYGSEGWAFKSLRVYQRCPKMRFLFVSWARRFLRFHCPCPIASRSKAPARSKSLAVKPPWS